MFLLLWNCSLYEPPVNYSHYVGNAIFKTNMAPWFRFDSHHQSQIESWPLLQILHILWLSSVPSLQALWLMPSKRLSNCRVKYGPTKLNSSQIRHMWPTIRHPTATVLQPMSCSCKVTYCHKLCITTVGSVLCWTSRLCYSKPLPSQHFSAIGRLDIKRSFLLA